MYFFLSSRSTLILSCLVSARWASAAIPSPFLNRLRMNRDAADLREILLHKVFERRCNVMNACDGQIAVHGAVAGSQNFMFDLAHVNFVAIHKLVVFAG